MIPQVSLRHEFVEYIPDKLEERTLYVSIEFATVAHKCCCGCGREVVTPLSPTDWKVTYDGQTVSLDPSIGNWSFECRSHYWIRHGKAIWAARWSQEQIDAGRAHDSAAKSRYFEEDNEDAGGRSHPGGRGSAASPSGWLRRLLDWLFGQR